jgi:hypothetical protein
MVAGNDGAELLKHAGVLETFNQHPSFRSLSLLNPKNPLRRSRAAETIAE